MGKDYIINGFIETWQEIYQPKTAGGAASSVFMTEISTSIGPSTTKKSSKKLMVNRLPMLLNNYNSTA